MPTCTVCSHLSRETIDRALAVGTSQRSVAEEHGLSKDAVRRHRDSHLTPALRKVVESRQTGGAARAVDELAELRDRARRLLDAAEGKGDLRTAGALIGQLRGIVELLAKLTGELDERPTVQILNLATSAEWLQIRQLLAVALTPYPEAAQAVASALLELEP